MSIRDEKYNWKNEAEECSKEIKKCLEYIFEKYGDKFTLEDLYYLVCTEANEVIMFEIFKKKEEMYKTKTLDKNKLE